MTRRRLTLFFTTMIAGIALAASALVARTTRPATGESAAGSRPASILITRGLVIDGTGAAPRQAAVRIAGDIIAAVGAPEALPGEEILDARGLVLAPGFIDTHSHADDEIFEHRDALAAVSQGITTVVVGQDGGGPLPLSDFFARLGREPAAVNVAAYAGHGAIRSQVLGKDFRRAATRAEIRMMREILEREMAAGALGLSTGLEYDPGIYSDPGEVVTLAKSAAARGGRYISHIRSEDREFWKAVDEIIAIGRRARMPVQVSHTKLAMKNLWGQADRLIATLDAARASGVDITGDMYPYLYWESTLTVLFPRRNFEDRVAADLVLREIVPPDGLLLTRFDPEPSYVGKTVAAIATLRDADPAATLMDLIRESQTMETATGRQTESVIGTSMTEPDVERLMTWPHMNFCTDGGLAGSHPRGYGSYPRVLGHYVRGRRVLSLEQAVFRMTGLAAAHVGFTDRGTIAPGQRADLVLFDPSTVIDRATPADPRAISEGIRTVWVNGAIVFEDGRTTGRLPGRVVRRAAVSDVIN